MLDVIVRLDEPLAPGSDVRAATRTGAGGQAANVAAWAVSLGAEARVVAALGDDAAAGLVRNELLCRGTPAYGPVYTGVTGVVVSIVATEAEWEILGGAYMTAPLAVLKRGARGCTIVSPDARIDLAPLPVEVADATGAGDALAAGFLLGGSLEEAGRRGLEAAARCVG